MLRVGFLFLVSMPTDVGDGDRIKGYQGGLCCVLCVSRTRAAASWPWLTRGMVSVVVVFLAVVDDPGLRVGEDQVNNWEFCTAR